MPDRIVIAGVPPWDGSYDFDLEGEPLTVTEWGWIKRRAGYLPLTLTREAWSDPELISVLGAIAVRRSSLVETNRDMEALLDRLFEAPFGGTVTLQLDVAGEDDAGPPPGSSEQRLSSNGDSSTTASESSAGPAAATGAPRSDTSESALTTSAS